MHSVVAILGLPEFVGILMVLLIMLNAERISRMFNGLKHGMHEFIEATRSVDDVRRIEADADEGEGFQRYGFKFWLIVALGVALCAVVVALRELLQ